MQRKKSEKKFAHPDHPPLFWAHIFFSMPCGLGAVFESRKAKK
jgi:hypothetical protein